MRNPAKHLRLLFPYLFFGLYATKLSQAWRLAEGASSSQKLLHLMDALNAALQSPYPSFHPADLLCGLLCALALRLAVFLRSRNAKKYRHDAEYGTPAGGRQRTSGLTWTMPLKTTSYSRRPRG